LRASVSAAVRAVAPPGKRQRTDEAVAAKGVLAAGELPALVAGLGVEADQARALLLLKRLHRARPRWSARRLG